MKMICVSVCARTAEELIQNIKQAEESADAIEIRFDCLGDDQFEPAIKLLSEYRGEKQLLATCRPAGRKAEFNDAFFTAETLGDIRRKRLAKWEQILALENINFVDVEG